VDLDNDGWLDLFAVNGHIYPEVDKLSGFKEGFGQRPLLFRQSPQGTFTEIGLRSGLAKLKSYSSRGAAYADFDNDGDLDIVYTNLGAAPTFLENTTPSSRYWITVQTVGTRSNRGGIGARLKLRAGDLIQYATVRSGESYLSGNDPRAHFGLGDKKIIDELEIRWPSGQVDKVTHLDANQFVKVKEGEGLVPSKHDKE
jgi:enediyne biosynthesis protein E4